MSDLRTAILDARYIDVISLGDFVVRDCGLPDMDSDGNYMPQAAEIAAAVFRWAADVQAREAAQQMSEPAPALQEYDEEGDPIMDAETAERLEAELAGTSADAAETEEDK